MNERRYNSASAVTFMTYSQTTLSFIKCFMNSVTLSSNQVLWNILTRFVYI